MAERLRTGWRLSPGHALALVRQAMGRLAEQTAAPRYQVLYQLSLHPEVEPLLRRLGPLRHKDVRRFVSLSEVLAAAPTGQVQLLRRTPVQLLTCGPRFADRPADLDQARPTPQQFPGPDLCAAVLHQAEVLGGSSVVLLPGQRALYDLRTFDRDRRFRYSDEGLHGYRGDLCVVKRQGQGPDLARAIHLGGNYSWNYYHFLIELLPRLRALDELHLDPAIPLLVDKVHLEIPQHLALLTALNRDHRPLVAMQPAVRYRVAELYYCSFPSLVVPNYHRMSEMRSSDTLLDAQALTYVRDRLLQHGDGELAPAIQGPKRIYLSRKKASQRRKFNEDEVLAALQPLGVVAIHPEELAIQEQISLFGGAELVIGGSGAAFTNLLFCRPGCKALIIAKERLQAGLFSSLAAVAGVDLLYTAASAEAGSDTPDPHGAFEVDAQQLADLVAAWLQQAAEQA